MDILHSKKFQAAALAAILAFAGFYAGFTTAQVATVVSPLLVYIGGQALADFGKERVVAEAAVREVTAAMIKDLERPITETSVEVVDRSDG